MTTQGVEREQGFKYSLPAVRHLQPGDRPNEWVHVKRHITPNRLLGNEAIMGYGMLPSGQIFSAKKHSQEKHILYVGSSHTLRRWLLLHRCSNVSCLTLNILVHANISYSETCQRNELRTILCFLIGLGRIFPVPAFAFNATETDGLCCCIAFETLFVLPFT